jgi:DnaK suppressor protein
MNKKKLEEFRKILQGRLDALTEEAKKSVGEMKTTEETFADPTDLASHDSDRNFMHRIKDRERKLMIKIKEALDRIDGGSYGVCELCGGDISEARLRARPVTTQCIECKTEMEHLEKK